MEINEREIIQKAKIIGEKIRGINNWEELYKHSNKSIIEYYDRKAEKKNNRNMEMNKTERNSSNYSNGNK